MIRRRVTQELWDYSIIWVSEKTLLTHSSAGKLEVAIPLTEVTGETSDIYEYLDFGFISKILFKDNTGESPFEPGRWLEVSHRTGHLICYHLLTQTGTVISRSTFQRFTNIKETTAELQDMFQKFNEAMQQSIKIYIEDGYIGDKYNPYHWTDLIDND